MQHTVEQIVNTNEATGRTFKDLFAVAIDDTERFRIQAAQALAHFTPADRLITQILDNGSVGTPAVLATWESDVAPIRKRLTLPRTADALQKALTKHLDIDADAARLQVEKLIIERCDQLLQSCTRTLYPLPVRTKQDAQAEQRAQALALLQQSDTYIADFKARYEQYIIYRQIAAQQNIAIYDPFAPWLMRKRAALKLSKQRRLTAKQQKQRLLYIAKRLSEITAHGEGLIGQIIAQNWDAVSIVSLKNAYDKRIASSTPPVGPTQRLAIFDDITGDFINRHIQKMAHTDPHLSLTIIKETSDNVATLLAKIFDLTNTQKNDIVLLLKEYRDLIAEQKSLLRRTSQEKQEQ